jgi:hypothetical protein
MDTKILGKIKVSTAHLHLSFSFSVPRPAGCHAVKPDWVDLAVKYNIYPIA